MGEKHVVRFEPVGIEIEVDEDQNILRAAAEQGVMLMHGCKEGQCASCKSFILEGDEVEHDKYSTFALPDFEMGDEISQILFPFVKKIAEYAAKKAMLGTQDVGQFSAWTKEWRDSLINCVQAAGQRNDADVEIVESFWGDD